MKQKRKNKKVIIPTPSMIPTWGESMGFTPPEDPLGVNFKKGSNQERNASAPAPQEDEGEMSDYEADSLLIELYGSKYWSVYKHFIDQQIKAAQKTLSSVDVFKEPTLAARKQGEITGVMQLEQYIVRVIDEREDRARESFNKVQGL